MAAASEAILVSVSATKTQVELCATKKTRLKPKDIGTFRVESIEIGLLYLVPTQPVVCPGHLTPLKVIKEIHPKVPFDILVASLVNFTMHVPDHMLVSSSNKKMVNITDPGQNGKESPQMVDTVQTTSKPPV